MRSRRCREILSPVGPGSPPQPAPGRSVTAGAPGTKQSTATATATATATIPATATATANIPATATATATAEEGDQVPTNKSIPPADNSVRMPRITTKAQDS